LNSIKSYPNSKPYLNSIFHWDMADPWSKCPIQKLCQIFNSTFMKIVIFFEVSKYFSKKFHFCIFEKFFQKREFPSGAASPRAGPNRSTGRPVLPSPPYATARWTPAPSRSHMSAASPLSGRACQPDLCASSPVYPWSRNPCVSHPFPLSLHSPPAGPPTSATTPIP
jgi:hypothetical protein